jgi:hypothetical protein
MAAATHGEGKAHVLATARCAAGRQDDRQRLEAANDPGQELTGATPISTASPPALAACGIGTLINAVSGPASYGELDYAQQAAAQPGHTAPTV